LPINNTAAIPITGMSIVSGVHGPVIIGEKTSSSFIAAGRRLYVAVKLKKRMGSRKLILLPQVLPIHTFDSAYHVFPLCAPPCLAKPFRIKIHPCGYHLTRSCST